MKCPRCQVESPDGARFCEECGAHLETACPSCGQAATFGKKFCRSCGASLSAETTRFLSPAAYTPRHLAEKILTSRSALEGERKQVTVLFADMKGSMELLADRDPEEAQKILDPVLERMIEAVHRYEGTVNQVMGDGIMALFGAPLAHEDHAVRACYAALEMQAAIRRYAEEARRSYGVTPEIRVGLNSGEVVVRAIGSDLRRDYTAVGQITHLAARMEQLATPGTVRLTPTTLRLTEGYVEVKPLGLVPVKGLSEPIEVYELTGLATARTRLQAMGTRNLTRFVGRDAELDVLRTALHRAARGHGQVVVVVGDPGVGKSRLIHEFRHSHHATEWRVLESSALSYGRSTAYVPVVQFLKAFFEVEDRDDRAGIRQKVVSTLSRLALDAEPILPVFLSLFDLPVDANAWNALDPIQRRQRTLDAVQRLIVRESQSRPVLLILEDLQWIDSETEAMLDRLVDSLPTTRVMILASARLEHQPRWTGKIYYTHVRIGPLPAAGAKELLQVLLGDDPTLERLKRRLVEQTQGNPFFLEESVRTLLESRVLVGERGAYRLAGDATIIQVPPTVQSVLAARLDRLPPEDKSLLQSASVIGTDVPRAILEAIADLPEDELNRVLASLQALEFLYETMSPPYRKYTFTHALTHEVTYGSLVQARRAALHARIVEAIETLYADRLDEQLDQLAHHALRGLVWDKAVTYVSQAGIKAAARCANHEAAAYFEKALVALRQLPRTPERLRQGIELRLNLRNALLQLGEPARIIDHLVEAETLAQALDDTRCLGRVVASMSHYFWLTGQHVRAFAAGERARAIARDLRDFALEVTANYYLGLACHSLGRYRQGAEILRGNVASLPAGSFHESFGTAGFHSVFARGWLVCCLAELGAFSEAIARAEEAVRIAEAADEPFSLTQAYLGIGGLHLRTGDFARGIPPLERALRLCEASHIRVLVPRVAAYLGYMYTISGRLDDAVPVLEQAVDKAFAMKIAFMYASALLWLSEAYLAAHRHDDAMARARAALEHARRHQERGNEAWTLRVLADIAGSGEPADAEHADGLYREALALAEELEMRPLVARCRLGLARSSGRLGRAAEARDHVMAATALFRDLGMHLWLTEAEAEQASIP